MSTSRYKLHDNRIVLGDSSWAGQPELVGTLQKQGKRTVAPGVRKLIDLANRALDAETESKAGPTISKQLLESAPHKTTP